MTNGVFIMIESQWIELIANFILSFMISIHSRVVHLSHLKEMSAIFSITTDINDISATQVLDRDFLLVLNVNQFLSRYQSREESGFNFWCRLGRQPTLTVWSFFNQNQILYFVSIGCLPMIGTIGNLCLPSFKQRFLVCTEWQPTPVKRDYSQEETGFNFWCKLGSLHSQCGLFLIKIKFILYLASAGCLGGLEK